MKDVLWETDLVFLLAQHFDRTEKQILQRFSCVLTYYEQLQLMARALLHEMDTVGFHDRYPRILAVDAKCRILLSLYPILLEETNQQTFIHMIERDFGQAYEESFLFEPKGYEQALLNCKLYTASGLGNGGQRENDTQMQSS